MAFNPKSTLDISQNGIKIALFGESGVGKTWQIGTLRRPFIISSEKGLLTLNSLGLDIPYVEVTNMDELKEARIALSKDHYDDYDTLVIDSVTEIAELCLSALKKSTKDKRQAYGDTQDQVSDELRNFFSITGKDIVMIFKSGRIEDKDTGKVSYAPIANNDKFSAKIPYLFDEVLALRVGKNNEGNISRYIQTQNDGTYACKDRSGFLYQEEEANLGQIIEIIKNKGVTDNGEE